MSTIRDLWQKTYRSLFGDVHEGEEKSVYTLLLIIFLLLVGYYILKTVREPLILASGGAELKSYAAAAQAGVLLFLVPLYSYITSRVDRKTLIVAVTLFFVACIQFFYFGSRMNRDRDDLLANDPAETAPFDDSLAIDPETVIEWNTGESREITFRQNTPNSPIFALFFDVEASEDVALEDVMEVTITPVGGSGGEAASSREAQGDQQGESAESEQATGESDDDSSGAEEGSDSEEGSGATMQPPAFEGRGWEDETDARITFKPAAAAHDVTVTFSEDVGTVRLVGVQKARWPWLGFAFFVWVGIFSVAIISLFWSFSNDIFHRSAGERLFPVIAIGATAGAPVGSFVAGRLFDAGVAPFAMLQITAGVLVLSMFLYQLVEQVRGDGESEEKAQEEISGSSLGFDLLFKNRYLALIALLMLILNLVNTNGEFILSSMVEDMANAKAAAASVADPDAVFSQSIGSFYGNFYSIVNVVALIVQAFIVSRLVKFLGIRGVLFALPIVAMGTYAVAAAGFGLVVFRWAKTAENATDYSVMNTGKAILWLPTTREEKYKAKQAIDTFIVRFGDMISAALVFVFSVKLSLGVDKFGMINLGLIVVWLVLTYFIVRQYKRLAAEADDEIDASKAA